MPNSDKSSVISNQLPVQAPIQIPKPSNFAKAQKFQVPKGRDYAGFRRGSR